MTLIVICIAGCATPALKAIDVDQLERPRSVMAEHGREHQPAQPGRQPTSTRMRLALDQPGR
jgi:hypothetical protein